MKAQLNLYFKYFENKKFRSLFFNTFKMMISFLLPIILLFSVLSFALYSGARDAEIENLLLNNFSRSTNILNIISETLERDLFTIQKDSNISTVITTPAEEVEEQLEYLNSWPENAKKKLRFICVGNRMYSSIHIHSAINDYVVSWLTFDKREDFYDNQWIQEDNKSFAYTQTRIDPFTNAQVISIFRPIYQDDIYIGTAAINLDYNYIDDLFSNASDNALGSYVLTDADGKILYSTQDSEVGKNLFNSIYAANTETIEENPSKDRKNGENFYMSYTAQNGLTLHSYATKNDYPHYQSAVYRVLTLGFSAALVFSLLLSVIFTFRLYSYVLSIIESFQNSVQPTAGNSKSKIIRSGILSYIDRQETLESGFAANLAKLRKAQIMALQMQITPHFLLNTLQLINLNIIRQQHHDNDSTRLIVLLSDILRNLLSTEEYLTDFSSEIRMAKKYLEIESIRKEGMFESTWDVDPRIEQMSVVRCTLQPLLENCIQHGLSPNNQTSAKIQIRIFQEEDTICTIIEDNGKGMSQQKLNEIRHLLSLSSLPETIHIGLCNVSMRLRLIFGISDCISVESNEGCGTKVTLRFPAIPFFTQANKFQLRKDDLHVPHDHR